MSKSIFKTRMVRYIKFLMSSNREFREFNSFPFPMAGHLIPETGSWLMARCCEVLEEKNIIYRLTDGTILGLYREGAFIAHDNDIDIDILDFQDIGLFEASMKRLGMKLGRKVIYKKRVQQLVYYSKDHAVVDFVFWYSVGDHIFNYQLEGYERAQSKWYFMDLESIKYKEKLYPIPSHIEEWLIFRYGKDWRMPKIYKGDWKSECLDLKKI